MGMWFFFLNKKYPKNVDDCSGFPQNLYVNHTKYTKKKNYFKISGKHTKKIVNRISSA